MAVFASLTDLFYDPVNAVRETLMILPAIIIGLTVHEWAHAYAAHCCGDDTAMRYGRMTLNPLAHLDLYGFLMLLLFGFGWAKPVPVNPSRYRHFRLDDVIVSIAGVTMNFVTAFVFCMLSWVLAARIPSLLQNDAYWTIMQAIVSINLTLMVFNLIPLHPLDGSHVLESLLMRRAPKFCMFLRNYGRYILIALILFGVSRIVLSPIVGALYGWMNTIGVKLYYLLA